MPYGNTNSWNPGSNPNNPNWTDGTENPWEIPVNNPGGNPWDEETGLGVPAGGCPPEKPHMNEGQCSACPEGEWMHSGKCEPRGNAGGGGGGGGNGGGGSGGGGNAPNTPPWNWEKWTPPTKTPFELNLEDELKGFLDDWDKRVPFTADVIQNMKTGAKRNAFGQYGADKLAIEADAIERGVFQGEHTGRRLDNARRGYQSQFANDSRTIDTNAAISNDEAVFRNRTAALDRAMAHVNNEREFLLASEMSHFERQKGMAEVTLAYYNLEMQKWALKNEWDVKRYGIDKDFELGNRGMDMEWFWRMMEDAA